MKSLRYTLVSEGSSDAALLPLLSWLLRENGVIQAIQEEWADLPKSQLNVKIQEAIRLYPCDLLFVHRDADRVAHEERVTEITRAIHAVKKVASVPPAVCVVPVRMQEAWLLFDEAAIRFAANNRNGRIPLQLPPIAQLESLPDPKERLHSLLREASELSGRRLKKFRVHQSVHRVSQFIGDYSPLRRLPAFIALEQEITEQIRKNKWS